MVLKVAKRVQCIVGAIESAYLNQLMEANRQAAFGLPDAISDPTMPIHSLHRKEICCKMDTKKINKKIEVCFTSHSTLVELKARKKFEAVNEKPKQRLWQIYF